MEFITDTQIYEKVIRSAVPAARKFLWIGTADIKDLYVDRKGKMIPFLEVISDLLKKKVEIRLLFAKDPGEAFQRDFDKYPNLAKGLEQMRCPRVHFKTVVVDGTFAYSGSANLTGAGMGAKNSDRRNFESGFITSETEIVDQIMTQFDRVWMGAHCKTCQRKQYCTDYRNY